MSLHPRHGIHDPATVTPARALHSIRRTSHLDLSLGDDPRLLVVTGHARDLVTGGDGAAALLAEADCDAVLDYLDGRRLLQLVTSPANDTAALIGQRVTSGFRARLDAALADQRAAQSPLYALLDELPVAALISGYIRGHAGLDADISPAQLQGSIDLCAGWRRGGTIVDELEQRGQIPLVTGPAAPTLDASGDALAWHALPPLPARAMRRQRRLDLIHGDVLRIDAMFRDSHRAENGSLTVIHEYALHATVDRADLRVLGIEAIPRVLPWQECPAAATSASKLIGEPLAGLRERVRQELTGIGTCTHLNDLLRSLEDAVALAALH